jgi:predicted metal-dependent hydrolase
VQIKYRLVRSQRRKTIALQVKNAEVIVRAPYFVDHAYIENLVNCKSAWLNQKLASQRLHSPEPLTMSSSDSIALPTTMLIDGNVHHLRLKFSDGNGVEQINHELHIALIQRAGEELNSIAVIKRARKLIETWLKAEFSRYIDTHLPHFIYHTHLQPTTYKIKKYKARWGSCNSRGELSFNYILKMVPSWVADYVIIHELCHLRHMNHSTEFWSLVDKFCTTRIAAKKWLDSHQMQLIC